MLMEYVKKKREKKRCIPKEGMPHACKGMSKKKLIARVGNNKRESCKRVHPQITRNSPNTCTS